METPIHLAAQGGHAGVVEELLNDSNVLAMVSNGQPTKTGYSPLLLAAYGGHVECAKLLIDKGKAPLTKETRKQRLPLHAAALSGHLKLVQLLVSKNDKILMMGTNRTQKIALHFAVEYGNHGVVEWLLEQINLKAMSLEPKTMIDLIVQAAGNGGSSMLKLLLDFDGQKESSSLSFLDHDEESDQTCQKKKKNPLISAIYSKSQEAVIVLLEYMIEKGLNLEPTTERWSETLQPIQLAAVLGNAEVVKVLLSKPEYLPSIDKITTLHPHPLDLAAKGDEEGGYKEVFFELLKDCRVEYPTDGQNTLYSAVDGGNMEIVRKVVGGCPEMLSRTDIESGLYPVDHAADKKLWEMVNYLLDQNGKFKGSKFENAAAENRTDIVTKALGKKKQERSWWGGASNPCIEESDWPIFRYALLAGAARGGHIELLSLLLENHQVPANIVSSENKKTALHAAARAGHVSIMEMLLEKVKTQDKLAFINHCDEDDCTPLHEALWWRQADAAKYLLSNGADPTKDETTLHIAIAAGSIGNRISVDVLQSIIDAIGEKHEGRQEEIKREISKKDIDGNTPLHQAAISKFDEAFDLLKQNGADVGVKNNDKSIADQLRKKKKRPNDDITEEQGASKKLKSESVGESSRPAPEQDIEENGEMNVANWWHWWSNWWHNWSNINVTSVSESAEGRLNRLSDLVQKGSLVDKNAKAAFENDIYAGVVENMEIEGDVMDSKLWADATSKLHIRIKRLNQSSKTHSSNKRGLAMLTNDDQQGCYLGNMAGLLEHMKENKLKSLNSSRALKLIRANPAWWEDGKLGRWLKSIGSNMETGNFNIDHVIPDSLGGTDHPYNYFILCGSINQSFNAWYTHEKVAYIGLSVVKRAKNFAGWVKRETQKNIDFSGYDPIREGALR